jgi:hypothetical protein
MSGFETTTLAQADVQDAKPSASPRATGESRLDSPTTPPRCDGCGYDRGFRNRRAARCDSLGHDSGFRYWRADDTHSSYACWSEGHSQSPSVVSSSSASMEAMIA